MAIREVPGYCGLCAVNCPSVVSVDGERVLALKADPTHPFGGVICAKGRAAPELHDHPHRLNYPLRRTHPKGDADPGWERISWDEALSLVAAKMLAVRQDSGAQAVAFAKGTGGGTGLTDTEAWLSRLTNHFGSPNTVSTTHLCQWPRDTGGAAYTFGTDRLVMPDLANSRCIVLWGSNPSANFLTMGHDVARAKARGAKLLVVDPRRIGLANKADILLQPRPGTDGALALSLIHMLITRGWYDEAFVRDWTNGPLLISPETGQLLRADGGYVAAAGDKLIGYDPETATYEGPSPSLCHRDGRGTSVFTSLAELAAKYPPEVAERITGVAAAHIEAAAELLARNRPVSHYFHNGLVQHTNATQASRAIEVLYALLGDFDRPGGNVPAPGPKVNDIKGKLAAEAARTRLGRDDRPAGPPVTPGNIAAYDLYGAILEGEPYPVRALVAFGSNMLLANGDTLRGRAALERLEFFAQIELFETPTSKFADVLLPAADFLEAPALKLGFRYPIEAAGHVQRRPQIVEPLHERRGDVQIIFDLACRLGLGDEFWQGDVAKGFDYVLEPTGLTWQALADAPHGVSLPKAPLAYQKYVAKAFNTPTRKVELFATALASKGYPGLPEYLEPALSPVSTPEVAAEFPLVLTNAKRSTYLHSQHRALAGLRKIEPNPTAEIRTETAAAYGVANGDWIVIDTPSGSARAQARVTDTIVAGVVCANHGWWEGCEELGIAPLDPFSAAGANINLLVLNDRRDPVSGGTPHRSSLCRVRKA
ncbi:MAG TPA: molybdopterin-dependent oxidoreductase [Chloroflexota bacterium]|nr:molybdopterin-dependent oxidoreductase [Chloroflexota bacterium]